jgi:hypothetical protein
VKELKDGDYAHFLQGKALGYSDIDDGVEVI